MWRVPLVLVLRLPISVGASLETLEAKNGLADFFSFWVSSAVWRPPEEISRRNAGSDLPPEH
jgi:hypothetical protein